MYYKAFIFGLKSSKISTMNNLFVIIPVYNAEKWIEKAVSSIFNQSYPNIWAICVDDNSSDSTNLILDNLKTKFPNLIVLTNDKKSGVSCSRNMALDYLYERYSKDTYISFLDADDFLSDKNCFEDAIKKMVEEKSDICFYEFTRFWERKDGIKTLEYREESFKKLQLNCQDIKYFWYPTQGKTVNNYFITSYIHGAIWRSVFKMTLLKENNLHFDELMSFAEDQIFLLHYLLNVRKISYIEKSTLMYRGWTKKHIYKSNCASQLYLFQKQMELLALNSYYDNKSKKDLLAFLKVQTYFAIVYEEYKYGPNPIEQIKKYQKEYNIQKLLNVRGFHFKNKIEKNFKKLIFYILSKCRMFKIIEKLL